MSFREIKKPNLTSTVSLVSSAEIIELGQRSGEPTSRIQSLQIRKLPRVDRFRKARSFSLFSESNNNIDSDEYGWWNQLIELGNILLKIARQKNPSGKILLNVGVSEEFHFPDEKQIKNIFDPEANPIYGRGDLVPKLKIQALINLIDKFLLNYLQKINKEFENFVKEDKKKEEKECRYFEIPDLLRPFLDYFVSLSIQDSKMNFFNTLGKNYSEEGEILILLNKFIEHRNFLFQKLAQSVSHYPKDLLSSHPTDIKGDSREIRNKKMAEVEQTIRTLVKLGAPIDVCESSPWCETYSLLDEACIDGDDDLACLLLDLKAEGSERTLGFAISGGSEKALERILGQDVKITCLENYIDAITHEPWKANICKMVFAAEKPAEYSEAWETEIWQVAWRELNPHVFQILMESGLKARPQDLSYINRLIRRKEKEPRGLAGLEQTESRYLNNLKAIKVIIEHPEPNQQNSFKVRSY